MKFYCVYKQGGVYTTEYVNILYEKFKKNISEDIEFLCLSDCEDSIGYTPLKYSWAGWWSKIELFRPDIKDDILYLDLDSIICGNLDDIINTCKKNEKPIMLSDFYFNERHASGMMWLPKKHRDIVWNNWIDNQKDIIERCKKRGDGDQKFIAECFGKNTLRWQELVPDQIFSYKIHCSNIKPKNARIVCYHGIPKPHQTNWDDGKCLVWKRKLGIK